MRIGALAEYAVHLLQLLMRKFQKPVDQAEFVHHLQRRGMHGVAAEIPEEIGVLLQHHDIDARRVPADSPASCRPDRRRQCSIGC